MNWRHSASGLTAEGRGVGRAVAVPSTDDVARWLLAVLDGELARSPDRPCFPPGPENAPASAATQMITAAAAPQAAALTGQRPGHGAGRRGRACRPAWHRPREHERRTLPVRTTVASHGYLVELGRNLGKRDRKGRTADDVGLGQHEKAERRPRRCLAVKFVRRWCGAQRGKGACYRPMHHDGVAGLTGQQCIKVSPVLRCGPESRLAVWHFIVRKRQNPSTRYTPPREVCYAPVQRVRSM